MQILRLTAVFVFLFASNHTTERFADCKPLEHPKHFPPLNVLLDSAALAAQLQTLSPPSPPEVVISVRLSDTVRTYVAGIDAPSEYQDAVRRAVQTSLRPIDKKSPESFRLHWGGHANTTLKAERSMFCEPTLVGGDDKRVPFVVGKMNPMNAGSAMPRGNFTPTITVGEDGKVLDVTFGTGSDMDNANTRRYYSQRQYRPALLDGRPVTVRVTGKKVELVH